MGRRSFFLFLASLPFVGKFISVETVDTSLYAPVSSPGAVCSWSHGDSRYTMVTDHDGVQWLQTIANGRTLEFRMDPQDGFWMLHREILHKEGVTAFL